MRRWIFVLPVVALLCAGCSQPVAVSNVQDRVVNVSRNDASMNAAMETARKTVGKFTAALANPKSTHSGFAVKMPISDGSETEHFWLSNVTFDGKLFHGNINNEPETVKTVKLGQAMTLTQTQMSDWMYLENGKLVGGYTIRVLRDVMTPAERAEFDKTMPFTVQ